MNATETYLRHAVTALGAPEWLAPVLGAALKYQHRDGLIVMDDLDRAHVAEEVGLTRNALNQALHQLCKRGVLHRQNGSYLPRLEVFPAIDWARLREAKLVVHVDSNTHVYMADAE